MKENIEEKNKDVALEENKKLKLCLKVEQIGQKSTLIKTFHKNCQQLNRHPQHVKNFILEESGVQRGSIKEKGLFIKSVLSQKDVEGIIVKYYNEYVKCKQCQSKRTRIERNSKLRKWYLLCLSCEATEILRKSKGIEKNKEPTEKA